jgi:hypothetical protein
MEERFGFYLDAITEILDKDYRIEEGYRLLPEADYRKLVYYLRRIEEESENAFLKSHLKEELIQTIEQARAVLKTARRFKN